METKRKLVMMDYYAHKREEALKAGIIYHAVRSFDDSMQWPVPMLGEVMEIRLETLKELLGKAFDLGFKNSHEFKNDLLDELMSSIKEKIAQEFRVYSCIELKTMPEGTIFDHKTMGRCWVIVRPDKTKAMKFERGGNVVGITTDGEPWDKPMKLLHSERVDE